MGEKYSASKKVYSTKDGAEFSILDMLAYFEKYGAMGVSDLHLKVNAPPAFRIDGNLVKLKGKPLTTEMTEQLI